MKVTYHPTNYITDSFRIGDWTFLGRWYDDYSMVRDVKHIGGGSYPEVYLSTNKVVWSVI